MVSIFPFLVDAFPPPLSPSPFRYKGTLLKRVTCTHNFVLHPKLLLAPRPSSPPPPSAFEYSFRRRPIGKIRRECSAPQCYVYEEVSPTCFKALLGERRWRKRQVMSQGDSQQRFSVWNEGAITFSIQISLAACESFSKCVKAQKELFSPKM